MGAALTAETALAVWERGRSLPMLERGVLLLAVVRPHFDAAALLRISIGERDAELLRARRRWFGDAASGVVGCPNCSERTEVDLRMSQLLVPPTAARTASIECSGRSWTLRAPTTLDLQTVRAAAAAERRRTLALQCLEDERGAPPDAAAVDDACCKRVSEALERIDPQADVRFKIECTKCGFERTALFDVVRFLWEDLEQFALRLLADVHLLARAYGWSERTVLGLSPTRRGLYLRMVQG